MPIHNDEFEKIQAKLMNRTIDDPRLARLTESIQSNQSFLDGNFLVENKKLKEVLKECLEWLENAPFDYSNGNVEQGIDEGEYYGGRGHSALVEKIKSVLGME
jgi:hypothetical protein